MVEKITLTSSEALAAMHRFLELYWERGQSEEIAMLLGSLSLQPDGRCADPALWNDWNECVGEIIGRRQNE